MTNDEIKILLDAASAARLDPASLKPVNPWTQKGATAETLQMAVQQNFPHMAAQWRIQAGESLSLAATAAKQGLTQMSPNAAKELAELDHDTIVGQQEAAARREADALADMEQKAAELAQKREAQTQQFARQAGNSSGGGHVRQFYQRLGITNPSELNNIPARRILPNQ